MQKKQKKFYTLELALNAKTVAEAEAFEQKLLHVLHEIDASVLCKGFSRSRESRLSERSERIAI